MKINEKYLCATTVVFSLSCLFNSGCEETIPCSGGEAEIVWAIRAGGSQNDSPSDIAAFPDGSMAITGYFGGAASFKSGSNSGDGKKITLNSSGEGDIFLVYFDSKGRLLWAKSAGGAGYDEGNSVAALQDGSVLIVGSFQKTATFGSGEANETVLESAGDYGSKDIFISKYSREGMLQWAKRAGGAYLDEANDVEPLADGSFIITGSFSETATFGPGEDNEKILISAGKQDVFIAKYDKNGELLWIKSAGAWGEEYGREAAVLSDGSILETGLLGSADSDITFSPGEEDGTIIIGEGIYDPVFVAKYDSQGLVLWVETGGSLQQSSSSGGIYTSEDGSSVITGYVQGKSVFGLGEENETTIGIGNLVNTYVAKYNPDGTLAWVKSAAGPEWDEGEDVAVFDDGSVLIAGRFGKINEDGGSGKGSVVFGEGGPNETEIMSAGGFDGFVAKYSSEGAFEWARREGGENDDSISAMALSTDGSVILSGSFNGNATFGACESNETTLSSAGGRDIFIMRLNLQ